MFITQMKDIFMNSAFIFLIKEMNEDEEVGEKNREEMQHKAPIVVKGGNGCLPQLMQRFQSGIGECRWFAHAFCILRTYLVR